MAQIIGRVRRLGEACSTALKWARLPTSPIEVTSLAAVADGEEHWAFHEFKGRLAPVGENMGE